MCNVSNVVWCDVMSDVGMFVSLAQVLCELFQSAPQRGNVPISGNISGFIRRLFLQLMLEDEKVTVFLQSPCPVSRRKPDPTKAALYSDTSKGKTGGLERGGCVGKLPD